MARFSSATLLRQSFVFVVPAAIASAVTLGIFTAPATSAAATATTPSAIAFEKSMDDSETSVNDKKDPAKMDLLAVRFHADYCGTCRAMEPTFNSVTKLNDDRAVKFITFDFSSKESKAQAEAMAKKLGLEDIYKKNRGKTGYGMVIDNKSKKMVSKLSARQSADAMNKTITKAFEKVNKEA